MLKSSEKHNYLQKEGENMQREQTTIRLPVELKDKLQQEAEKQGYTLRDLIVFILWDFVHATTRQE